MGYIYKIWNEKNDNVYIGQTTQSLQSRWKEHIYACHNTNYKKSHLYSAMRLYGEVFFHIEEIEQCDNILLDEREKYWIKYYDSYNNGYNMTIGGQNGRPVMDDDGIEQIRQAWDDGLSVADIVRKTGYTRTQVRSRLSGYKDYEEKAYERGMESSNKAKTKAISQWDLKGNLIATYNSGLEAEEKTGISHKSISSVVRGKGKTAGGFVWTYAEDSYEPEKCLKICQYSLDGVLIQIFNSKAEAGKKLGIDPSGIGKVCKGRQKSCHGFIFKEELR